jgi:hypothetical protein
VAQNVPGSPCPSWPQPWKQPLLQTPCCGVYRTWQAMAAMPVPSGGNAGSPNGMWEVRLEASLVTASSAGGPTRLTWSLRMSQFDMGAELMLAEAGCPPTARRPPFQASPSVLSPRPWNRGAPRGCRQRRGRGWGVLAPLPARRLPGTCPWRQAGPVRGCGEPRGGGLTKCQPPSRHWIRVLCPVSCVRSAHDASGNGDVCVLDVRTQAQGFAFLCKAGVGTAACWVLWACRTRHPPNRTPSTSGHVPPPPPAHVA